MVSFNDTKQTVAERTRTTNYEEAEAFDPDSPELGLYKLTINNLLEDTYYREDTDALAELRAQFEYAADSSPEFTLKLAAHARAEMYLRDVAQVLLVLAAHDDRTKAFVRPYARDIIQRADEPTTVVAIHDTLFGGTLPNPLKKGINDALHQFDEYQFSKYSTDRREVNLKDVLNRTHPAPRDDEHDEIFERLMRGDLDNYPGVDPLEPPETWETTISEQGNTRDAWMSVLPRMGLFATIRNLRNMLDAGVSEEAIVDELDIDHVRHSKLYPFRFYQAYTALKDARIRAPAVERWLSKAIDVAAENLPDTLSNTYVSIDLSGSMDTPLSPNSSMTCKEIGALFGALLYRQGAETTVFANDLARVGAHVDTPTLELAGLIREMDVGGATNGWKSIRYLRKLDESVDRIVILTDMQIWDSSAGRMFFRGGDHTVRDEFLAYRDAVNPDVKLYMLDLSSYGDLVTPEGMTGVYNISGWTDDVIQFIEYAEHEDAILEEIQAYEPQESTTSP